MNFRQLEYFTTAARLKSISKAAQELHVAQPPVSRQIALLEDELGVCLFLRTNKGIELTEAGQSLYVQSKHIFQSMHTMIDSVRDIDQGCGLLETWINLFHYFFHLGFSKEISCGIPQCRVLHPHGNSWGSFERSEQWRSSRDISPGDYK